MALIPTDDADIVVFERDDPLLTLNITSLQADGVTTVPYDFTGTDSLEFLVKARASDLDAAALARYTLTTGVLITAPATSGVCTVQCSSADATATPGTRRYQLVGTKAGKRQTLMVGRFVVKDV